MVSALADLLRRLDAYLGHGRLLEAGLIAVKFTYAAGFALLPASMIQMVSFSDLRGYFPDWVLGLPFALAASLSLIGLILNAHGHERSKRYRIAGATVGMMVWIYILIGNWSEGVLMAGLTPWCFWCGIVGSLWIIRRGVLGLPRPGTPGAI